MPGTAPRRPAPLAAVLVVDPNAEQRALLCDLLSQLGLKPLGASSASEACDLLASAPAGVVVADGDALRAAELSSLLAATGRNDAPIVVAGTNRPDSIGNPRLAFVRKPYHYRELVHKIWSALGVVETQAKAAA
ncbi:hypothetical protein MalM25_12180 [Planctomycetes bacterium MalM25]|nr:hypothetical protein MalM25_12180 [Planctomycetes bacterium MalM25]